MTDDRIITNTVEIDLSPSTDFTLLDKIKALFKGNETVKVSRVESHIVSNNKLAIGLNNYIDKIVGNTERNRHLVIDNYTMWDGATIPDKKLGTLFLILGFFNPLWLVLSWFSFVVFDGKKKFGKAGLWHDGIFQNGCLVIDRKKYYLTFLEANKLFYCLSIYYGKSKPIAFIAYILVHLSLPVWLKYRAEQR